MFKIIRFLRPSKCLKTFSKWNLIQRLIIEFAKFNGGVYVICFRLKIGTLFGKFEQFEYEEFNTYVRLLCFWAEVYFFFGNLFQKSKLFVEGEI